jgi:hypothetical protein
MIFQALFVCLLRFSIQQSIITIVDVQVQPADGALALLFDPLEQASLMESMIARQFPSYVA